MKKFTLLLTALLMVSLSALAQIKLVICQEGGVRSEFIASSVDSIIFVGQGETPSDPVKPGTPNANGHEYVDLGLPSGLLWATCNVGADSPEEYGDYFAWGETEPKDYYHWDSYKWYSNNKFTKYCTESNYGTVDNKTILELSDDAANANWGGDWRMPTKEEQDELRAECTWTWTTKNGVNGYTVTGPNGNNVFLPAAGYRGGYPDGSDLIRAGSYGYYWSSFFGLCYSDYGCDLYFYSSNVDWTCNARSRGQSVRPVLRVE